MKIMDLSGLHIQAMLSSNNNSNCTCWGLPGSRGFAYRNLRKKKPDYSPWSQSGCQRTKGIWGSEFQGLPIEWHDFFWQMKIFQMDSCPDDTFSKMCSWALVRLRQFFNSCIEQTSHAVCDEWLSMTRKPTLHQTWLNCMLERGRHVLISSSSLPSPLPNTDPNRSSWQFPFLGEIPQ